MQTFGQSELEGGGAGGAGGGGGAYSRESTGYPLFGGGDGGGGGGNHGYGANRHATLSRVVEAPPTSSCPSFYHQRTSEGDVRFHGRPSSGTEADMPAFRHVTPYFSPTSYLSGGGQSGLQGGGALQHQRGAFDGGRYDGGSVPGMAGGLLDPYGLGPRSNFSEQDVASALHHFARSIPSFR